MVEVVGKRAVVSEKERGKVSLMVREGTQELYDFNFRTLVFLKILAWRLFIWF